MSWANSVLPVFMPASGQKPERLPESAIAVQIDTTLHRPQTRVSHGFQRVDHSFNRTAVMNYLYKLGLSSADRASIELGGTMPTRPSPTSGFAPGWAPTVAVNYKFGIDDSSAR